MLTYKNKFYAIACSVLFLLTLISGVGNLTVVSVFFVALTIFLWMEKSFRIGAVDIVILLLWVYELIISNFTQGRNNSLIPILQQFIFTAWYFIIRLTLRERYAAKLFLRISSIFFVIISLFCIVSFGYFQRYIYQAGFDNLYDFKYLYRPLGVINNAWATILFLFLIVYLLSVIFYGSQKKAAALIAAAPIVYCIMISFSRGIYLCLAIMTAVMIVSLIISRNHSKRAKIGIIIGGIVGLIVIGWSNKNEVLRTIRFNETVSQQRSMDSRVSSLEWLILAVNENPWLGVGTNNYSLAMDRYILQDDNISFTTFAPNIVSQLLLEKGIIGMVLWLSLAVVVIMAIGKSPKNLRNEQLFILFTLLMLLLRELTFPSLLISLRLQLIFAVLIGIYANNIHGKIHDVLSRPKC